MPRKVMVLFALVVAFTLLTSSVAFAARGGNCPPGFALEMHMHHDGHEHEHVHVGTSADHNGDGLICMKPITPDGSIHVHMDNNIR